MGEDDIGVLPEVVPEGLTNEEFLELKQAEEVREKEAAGAEPPGKTQPRV